MKPSKRLKDTIKLDARAQYKIALAAGLNPALLSHWLTGYSLPKPNDKRIIKVGKLIGLEPSECFEV